MGTKNGAVVQVDSMTERQQRVAALRLHGWTLERIAKEIGVSTFTVHADLKRVRDIWKERQSQTYDELVAASVERLDQLREALEPKIASGSIAAVEAGIRLEDRYARLVGIDKPVETKVTISIETVTARIAELKAKRDGLPIIEGEIVEETA